MPLFRAAVGDLDRAMVRPDGRIRKRRRRMQWLTESCGKTDEEGDDDDDDDDDDDVLSLTRLCLRSLADNMKEVWVKDYADNYLDRYSFRHIMGPFNSLPGELVEDLTWLLCGRKQLSRAALHLLLVPQLRGLSLERCPALVTPALCGHIAARCQDLWSLNLSGAQQLPSKLLSETLCRLPGLRSLSLAGTPCDPRVIGTVAGRCPALRHLDVSRCHLLSPAALLPLGRRTSTTTTSRSLIPAAGSPPPPLPPPPLPPLSSLLALDIGLGDREGDSVAAAAYLLLSLPGLQRVGMDGVAQACSLILHRDFCQTEEFTDREGVPRLREVWEKWSPRPDPDRRGEKPEGVPADDDNDDDDSERRGGEGSSSYSLNQANTNGRGVSSQSRDERPMLRLKDVRCLSPCDSLDGLSRLCPNMHSVSVNLDDCDYASGRRRRSQGSVLAAGLEMWSGQLQVLSVRYPGPLVDLLTAVKVSGPSLTRLALEGVRTCPQSPVLEVIRACPRLRELLISGEPPATMPQEEEEEEEEEENEEEEGQRDEEDRRDDQDLPKLPDLRSLILKFSYEHSQMKPVMSWMSLKRALVCLLTGSPLLRRLSLVSLPCPLNCLLRDVLSAADSDPLGRLQHIELQRTDVKMTTVKSIMQRSKRLKCVDVSYCWQISQSEWMRCETFSKVQVLWS